MAKTVELSSTEVSNVVAMFSMEGPTTVDLRPPLQVPRDEMIRLWELGLLNNTTYVYLALKYEIEIGAFRDRAYRPEGQSNHQLQLTARDYDHLARSWRGTEPKNKAGDVKELDFETIDAALAALGKKEILWARSQQLTLFLGAESTINPMPTGKVEGGDA
jgi:hypothetical protein